jgi:hypothetical protein
MWFIITILFCIVFAVTWLVAGYSFIRGVNLTVGQYVVASFLLMLAGAAIATRLSGNKRK